MFKNLNTSLNYAKNLSSRKILNSRSVLFKKFQCPSIRNYANKVDSNSNLLLSISELMNVYNIKLGNFPTVVITGQQSSGKSSVTEALCNESILPKAMSMSTLKPFHITTIHSEVKKIKVGDKTFYNTNDAVKEIDRLNKNEHAKYVNIVIWSPDVHNSSFTDLPGLFYSQGEKDADLPKKVKQMTVSNLNNPNIIPIIVHSAPSDPATNQALSLAYKHKRTDALGVITKIDLLNGDFKHIKDLLTNKSYKLKHGYCCVLLRNDKDIQNGVSISDKINEEEKFISQNSELPFAGVNNLRKKISELQFDKIKSQIPAIIQDIDKAIQDLSTSENFLTNLINNDQHKLASKLKKMIEKLVGSSLERAEFESMLEAEFRKIICSHFKDTLSNNDVNIKLSEKMIDSNIISFNSNQKSNPEDYTKDSFKPLFSHGIIAPVFIDNEVLNKTSHKENMLSTAIPMIQFVIDDPLGKKRLKWYNHINSYFSKLLEDDYLHKAIYETTQKLLLNYIHKENDTSDDTIRKFAEYMIKEISSEAFEANIKFSITAMLNIEKRPDVSFNEIARHFIEMYPNYFKFEGSLFETFRKEKRKIALEVYGDEWNNAYLKAVIDKITINSYRNIAVNLLDRMVEKLLEITMDMFNKDIAEKEQKNVKGKIDRLIEIKSILKQYNNDNLSCDFILKENDKF